MNKINKIVLFASLSTIIAFVLDTLSLFIAIPPISQFFVIAVFYGYFIIAQKKKLLFLKKMSLLGIIYSIISVFIAYKFSENILLLIYYLTFGGILFTIFGISLWQLRKQFKGLATALSILTVITSLQFTLVLLAPEFIILGRLMQIPTTIIEAILLFKAARKL